MEAPTKQLLVVKPHLPGGLEFIHQFGAVTPGGHDVLALLSISPATEINVRAIRKVEPDNVDDGSVPSSECPDQLLHIGDGCQGARDLCGSSG